MSKLDYLAIIPEDVANIDQDQSYLRLPHPRTGAPQLYLPSSGSGRIYEVVKVNGSKRRTWFIGNDSIDAGSILIHHPVDPLFLVIPLILSLLPAPSSGATPTDTAVPFQPLSSLISTAASSSAHALAPPFTSPKQATKGEYNEDVSRLLGMKRVKRVFRLCCDRKVVPNGPPSPESLDGQNGTGTTRRKDHTAYYRPSTDAVLRLLKTKVEWFAQEERWGAFDHNIRHLGREGLLASGVDADLVKSARLKSSIDHFAQFLPLQITTRLVESYDFAKLDTHLANMSAAALAASMPPTNLANKADKAAAGAGAKRKAAASRGVEALKKVNTASMNKLTSFFKPKDK